MAVMEGWRDGGMEGRCCQPPLIAVARDTCGDAGGPAGEVVESDSADCRGTKEELPYEQWCECE